MNLEPDFRRATRDLVGVGEELNIIRSLLDDIQGVHGVSLSGAWFSAREARAAANRMSQHFRSVAYTLEQLVKEGKN
jgi:hypothetical protein